MGSDTQLTVRWKVLSPILDSNTYQSWFFVPRLCLSGFIFVENEAINTRDRSAGRRDLEIQIQNDQIDHEILLAYVYRQKDSNRSSRLAEAVGLILIICSGVNRIKYVSRVRWSAGNFCGSEVESEHTIYIFNVGIMGQD